MLESGCYTIVYSTGEHRTIWVKKISDGGLAGRTILQYRDDRNWVGFGFLHDGNTVQFWRKFEAENQPERLARIRRAVDVVAKEPRRAQLAFSMKEKRCARCQRKLTVPASLNAGLGPECAGKKRWTKQDNQMVFEQQKATAAA